MKYLIISLLAFVTFVSCKEDGFNYQMYKPVLDDVDSVYLSATDKMLIADGQARLDFIVEAYRRVRLNSGKDSMLFIDYRQLPSGSLKIMEERSGTEVGMRYSTTTIPFDTVKFHAELGGVKSATEPVALRAIPALPPKVYVDVIFHVWELNTAHTTYDPSSYQPVPYEKLQETIDYINQVVNNKVGHSPNGASANIEFRLAAKNAAGLALAQPGYNRITYSDNIKVNPLATSFALNDYIATINATTATYIWNPNNYLNIHVLPYGPNSALSTAYPAKQLPPAQGESLILGIAGIATGTNDFTLAYASACAALPRTVFFPGFERKVEAFRFIGMFYGLYTPVYTNTRLYSDYCFDTRKFDGQDARNSYSFATKVSTDGDKYITDNAMDDIRYPTLLTSLTADQVTRLRAVMARCPGRMNSKNQ
ncbi:hypothetical protein MKQ68_09800 [Chitinophaga horti]|uniref:Zinc-dependent metalloproteinase lipoprotein, BF0631 family n=1 Tax=Chitinophaga horti TaxID=2920382 RepID=A0ABY6J6T8_9BACT|nr:hypothetical protein [Chitinophaga horti]UYQ95390.1 hypothetical protein MKQ68_09800 [Chitinophaga horti]